MALRVLEALAHCSACCPIPAARAPRPRELLLVPRLVHPQPTHMHNPNAAGKGWAGENPSHPLSLVTHQRELLLRQRLLLCAAFAREAKFQLGGRSSLSLWFCTPLNVPVPRLEPVPAAPRWPCSIFFPHSHKRFNSPHSPTEPFRSLRRAAHAENMLHIALAAGDGATSLHLCSSPTKTFCCTWAR